MDTPQRTANWTRVEPPWDEVRIKYRITASLSDDKTSVTLTMTGNTWSGVKKEDLISTFDSIADFLIRETQEKEAR